MVVATRSVLLILAALAGAVRSCPMWAIADPLGNEHIWCASHHHDMAVCIDETVVRPDTARLLVRHSADGGLVRSHHSHDCDLSSDGLSCTAHGFTHSLAGGLPTFTPGARSLQSSTRPRALATRAS